MLRQFRLWRCMGIPTITICCARAGCRVSRKKAILIMPWVRHQRYWVHGSGLLKVEVITIQIKTQEAATAQNGESVQTDAVPDGVAAVAVISKEYDKQ